MIEVLSPAGGFDSFCAAVRSGADAVYFGAGDFNARRNAKNFTEDDIKNATEYARVRGVKTYLTLNTLTADSELSAALSFAQKAALYGVDALIVQDLGLARALRETLPNMPIHASTQMSVHSPDALPILKEMGFSRVVVAREMDKESLRSLCAEARKLGLEVEAFVHGALCMCLSGQCYLSSMLGGRSGNRGLCAQPCRLEFSVSGGTGHDLSLKDMSYIDHIKEMAQMGVTSFKIEGRMKRPEYVAAAVTAVRSAADGVEIPSDVSELLSGIFSRSGHTDGYYRNKTGVDMFGIRTEADTLMSAKMINKAHELYRRNFSRVPLTAEIIIKHNTPISLSVFDGEGHSAVVIGEKPEAAINRSIDAETVSAKLSKCGGTPYIMTDVKCDIDFGLSVPGSVLTNLRQLAFDFLTADRAKYDGRYAVGSTVDDFKLPRYAVLKRNVKWVVQFSGTEQIPEDLSGVSAVILPVETDFSKVSLRDGIELLADIPRGILHSSALVKKQLESAAENGIKAAVCGNLAAVNMCRDVGVTPIAGFGLNLYNTKSVEAVEAMGVKAAVMSFEMSVEDVFRTSGNIPKGIITYGRLPLMIFRNCPNKNGNGCAACRGSAILRDRKGIEFPVKCRGEFSEMFNSRPLWMLDRTDELKNLDFEVLMFTDESKERCAEVLSAARLKASPDCEFTRGLYYREVY